ncbi:hypothetical protein FRC06_005271 [Ceratobasidium sp. 370]|nr:hypothetical protein FRC06_005271 [Ceratobasidium sp. 370]
MKALWVAARRKPANAAETRLDHSADKSGSLARFNNLDRPVPLPSVSFIGIKYVSRLTPAQSIGATKLPSGTSQVAGSSLSHKPSSHADEDMEGVMAEGPSRQMVEVSSKGEPQYSLSRDASAPAAYGTSRQQPLPHDFPAPPINSHAAQSPTDSAALDAATAAIVRAGSNLDIGDTGLLNVICEKLRNPYLYTHPIARQHIIELLEIVSEEIAKTRAAGRWEITIRVAQGRHFVCPPQMEGTVKSYVEMIDTVNENSGSFDEDDLIARLAEIDQSKPLQTIITSRMSCLPCQQCKTRCDRFLPQCGRCSMFWTKCEYPPESSYYSSSSQGRLCYIVPTYTPPGPPPCGSAASWMYGGPQRPDAPALVRREPYHDSDRSPTGAPPRYDLVQQTASNYGSQVGSSSRHDGGDNREGHLEKGGDKGFADEGDDDARPTPSTPPQIIRSRPAAHLAHLPPTANDDVDVEMEDGESTNGMPSID